VPSPSRGSDHPDEPEKVDSTTPLGLILAAFQESQAFCTEIRLALVRYKFSSRQTKDLRVLGFAELILALSEVWRFR
jgi:hypothetical protein